MQQIAVFCIFTCMKLNAQRVQKWGPRLPVQKAGGQITPDIQAIKNTVVLCANEK